MQVNSFFNTPGTQTISAIFRPANGASVTVSTGVQVVRPLPLMHLKETAYILHQWSTIELEPAPSSELNMKRQSCVFEAEV